MTRARMEEYRRKAQECLELARKISLERERAIVLEVAQSWLRLAEQQENAPAPIDRAATAAAAATASSAQGRRQEGLGCLS
jgi:hypothetical protein